MCFSKILHFCICSCLQLAWMLRHCNVLEVHVEWKNALVKSRKLQALKIIQKSLSVTSELNLLLIHACFSAIFLPSEDNINVEFWKWDLGGWCPISDWHIWAHYTPNPCLQHCRAEVITSQQQIHQKWSTGTHPEHSIFVSQLKPAAHVTDQQTSFWKAECGRQCNEDLLIQVPLWAANHDTFTLHWPFFSHYSYKDILLPLIPRPEASKPAFLTTSIIMDSIA